MMFQSDVRAQDAVFIVVAVAMNSRGRDMTWSYFKENWQKLSDQYAVSRAGAEGDGVREEFT